MWVRCPGLSVVILLINLWCSFCPLLYILCAEEFQLIILIPKKAVLKQLTTKLLNLIFDISQKTKTCKHQILALFKPTIMYAPHEILTEISFIVASHVPKHQVAHTMVHQDVQLHAVWLVTYLFNHSKSRHFIQSRCKTLQCSCHLSLSSSPGTDLPARRPIRVLLHALFFASFLRFFIHEKPTVPTLKIESIQNDTKSSMTLHV